MATILIVEDEFAVARGIQYALQQEGYEVTVARSGEEGLEFATSQAPDLIVLDVRLPGMDGFEVLRRLRAVGLEGAGAVPDGPRRRVRQGRGPRARRRRLRHQAVRAARADEPHPGAPPPRLRRPRQRGRRPRDPPRRPRHRPRAAARPARDPADRRSPRPSSRSCATSPAARAACSRRRELLELLRDYEALDQDEKTINVHVSHLRDKIEDDPSVPQFVLTVRGAGYQFAER